ncbi:hypothetical protein M5689_020736 [Euphorbia peplus]|nr:hypothetical protein M5689_020736 [Euphorbia peplus]
MKSWTRFHPEWETWVKKLSPRYKGLWEKLGIMHFINLTVQPLTCSQNMVMGALSYWSPHCNSFIFPGGPMSITLRDILALTHLPISDSY